MLQWHHARQQVVRLAASGFEIMDTAQHYGRAQARALALEVCTGHPAPLDYARVQRPAFVAAQKAGDVDKAQELLAGLWMNPEVDADQFTAADIATGFLERLTNDGFFGRFAALDMTAGLIQDSPAHRTFLDEQILAIFCNDGRDRQVCWIHS
mgnify:CR=1 FL=1